MAVNSNAFLVVNPDPSKKQGALIPEKAPTLLWGQGTPDGDREPFLSAQKGTLYMQTDATDDAAHVFTKVDEAGDNDDWVASAVGTAIDNAAVASDAAIVGSKFATNARRQSFRSKTFNVDNGSGTTEDEPCFHAVDGITIIAIRRVYTEATDTAGAEAALTRIGTAVNGEQIVESVAVTAAKAVGATDTLTIVGAGTVAAGGSVFVRHTGVAATEAGQYYIQFDYTVDD